jgi:predicted CoA-substrate-specific enzyme activase
MFTLGMDIGSTTSKCVILKDGKDIAASSLVQAGIGTDGAALALKKALDAAAEQGIAERDIAFRMATGYGRSMWKDAEAGHFATCSELLAHALGGHFLFPEARTIIDIGGQDAKVIALDEEGRMADFAMNDKCAAGTGRFLDVMAGILKKNVGELEGLAAESTQPASISSTCTVFAESEVISQLAQGTAVPDVVAGICASVAGRVAGLARRVGVKEQVVMSGGVAQNGGVREAMGELLEVEIHFSPLAQLQGALGAALNAYKKN